MGKTMSRRSPGVLPHAEQSEQSAWSLWGHWSDGGQGGALRMEKSVLRPRTWLEGLRTTHLDCLRL